MIEVAFTKEDKVTVQVDTNDWDLAKNIAQEYLNKGTKSDHILSNHNKDGDYQLHSMVMVHHI